MSASRVIDEPAKTSASLPVEWSNVRGIMFDVDGTLTHSDDLHFVAFNTLLMEMGFNGAD